MTQFAALTHPGNREGENQDSIGWDIAQRLWFVADGMGGHASGEVASRLVKETMLAHAAIVGVPAAILMAHTAVTREAERRQLPRGMGSTVVAAQIADDRHVQVIWVGDSRAYLWRAGDLQRLTRDHSYLELLRSGNDMPEADRQDQQVSNIVTQALGMGTPDPSHNRVPLRRGDWLILCSDGLWVELRDSEIAQVLAGHVTPQAAADALLAATMTHGARDNVSIIVITYDGPDAREAGGLRELLAGRTFEWLAFLAGVVLAAAIAVLWRRWIQ